MHETTPTTTPQAPPPGPTAPRGTGVARRSRKVARGRRHGFAPGGGRSGAVVGERAPGPTAVTAVTVAWSGSPGDDR